MNALILEDDAVKRKWISKVFEDLDWEVTAVGGASQCSEMLRHGTFDIMVLDLMVPWEESVVSDIPDKRNSQNILSEIREGRCKAPGYVLGLTQDASLRDDNEGEFIRSGWILLHYDGLFNWRTILQDRIRHAENWNKNSRSNFTIDVAVITALQDPEAAAFLELVPGMTPVLDSTETYTYFRGMIGGRSVLLFTTVEMGAPAAASLTSLICSKFRPRIVVMCGIAAGIDKGLNLGDVVISQSIWNYASGKIADKPGLLTEILSFFKLNNLLRRWCFQPTVQQIDADPGIIQWIKNLQVFPGGKWWVPTGCDSFALEIGPVACGPWVVANHSIIDWLIGKERKILALEMEIYGVYLAAKVAGSPRPKFLGLKGVSDFANAKKNEQPNARILAARNSVRVLQKLLELGLIDRVCCEEL